MMTTTRCDVLVAGLGVVGGAVTRELARRGARVIGIDRHRVPHSHGSSHGETRNIRQIAYESPVYVPLVRRAFELWEELQADAGRPLLRLTGRIVLGRPDGPTIRGVLRSAEHHGLPLERLTPDDVRRRWPVLEPDDDMLGVYEERAGMLLAEPCVESQLTAAQRAGATLQFEERLLDWRTEGGSVVVRTDRSRYLAGRLVLVAGAWLPELAPMLPLTVERQVLLWFAPRDRIPELEPDRFPGYLLEPGPGLTVYGVPYWNGGMKAARHHGGELCTPATVRRDIDARDIEPVRAVLARHLPAAAGDCLRGHVCLYTNTPDRHFLVDRHPEHEAVHVVSACSGHGFKYAPAVGEAVAEELLGGRSALDLSFFRLDRLRG